MSREMTRVMLLHLDRGIDSVYSNRSLKISESISNAQHLWSGLCCNIRSNSEAGFVRLINKGNNKITELRKRYM
jgi:hypothetical protein